MPKHSDVAEHFIAQDKPKLSAGSMRFKGLYAYSWGTPIALLMADKGIVLIKPAGWHSWSTSTHCGCIDNAARAAKLRVFRVPSMAPDHDANVAHIEAELSKAFEGLGRARSAHEGWKRQITYLQKDLADYRAIFNVEPIRRAA